MKNVPDTPLGRMYRQHIEFILNKDIESLLNQYTDDALLISSFTKKPLYFKGREQMREHMQGILGIEGLETDIAFWAETEQPQTLMIVEAITMPDGPMARRRCASPIAGCSAAARSPSTSRA